MLSWFSTISFLLQISILYLLAINVVTFFFFGIDKLQAQLEKRRTPEKFLWFLTLLGGTPGALAGMNFFRHKTKKISFQLVLMLILVGQMLVFYVLFFQ